MNDGVYYMMLHKYKNKDSVKKRCVKKIYNNSIVIKSCIKNNKSQSPNKHVRFEGEWCSFFRFLYN